MIRAGWAMANTTMPAAQSLAARQRANVDFSSGKAELECITPARDSASLLGGDRLTIDRNVVVERPHTNLRNEHDEGVPGKRSAEGPARGGGCHRDDLLNWRPHFTPSPRSLEEQLPNRPATLATVKPPRNRRTRLREDV